MVWLETKDKELFRLKVRALMYAKHLVSTRDNNPQSAENIVENLQKAYELGFRRGYRAAKAEDMPFYFTDEEEKQYSREIEESEKKNNTK
jgi:hypothetical protein